MDKRKLSELIVEHREKAIGDHAFTPREISGALAAAAAFGLTEAKILTADSEGEERHSGVRIIYEPVWRWLVQ